MDARRIAHLLARVFDVVSARGLTGPERAEVITHLRPKEVDYFFQQPKADQRHGHHAARFVASQTSEPTIVRAALLHDLGKRHARLGVIGRSLATAWRDLGGLGRGRWQTYYEHGEVGAKELEGLAAEPLVIDFARHHHGVRPASIDVQVWRVLVDADRARLAITENR